MPRPAATPRAPLVRRLPAAAAAATLTAALAAPAAGAMPAGEAPASPIPSEAIAAAESALIAVHGEAEAERIRAGTAQVARYWRAEDGDAEAYRDFVTGEFVPRGAGLDALFARFEFALERVDGYLLSLRRDLRRATDLDLGPLLPLDRRLAGWSPGAHVADDLFGTKVAFVALLNFPVTTLEERLEHGSEWSRREWAETRLAGRFADRVPAEVGQRITAAFAAADTYISEYNVWMHHLLTEDGRRLFPEGLRLISHWGLRDELKARYADPEGLERQRMIATVFDRIVRQQIPAAVIDEPRLDWAPAANEVTRSTVADFGPAAVTGPAPEPSAEREPDTRFAHWRATYRALREADAYSPENPTFVDRRFNDDREIPEAEVRALFEAVLGSPLGPRVAGLVAARLGRPLEPFDIWYVGFRPRGAFSEEELDAVTRERYPTAGAFAADLPRILGDLGFPPEKARFLAERIVVEPSRGAGHAMGAARRDDEAHLRTRVGAGGMDYKGYNIAVHELGHNVEQVFSTTAIDHTLLQGVPNTAFTEALAFVFQGRDLELLGLAGGDPQAEHFKALDTFWSTREIAGVALVDMAVWRWLYEHPEATAAELRAAVVEIAREVWNRWYADIFGVRDVPLLAVYSHMIDGAMYTPDYPLGHLIAFQVEEHFETADAPLGVEFERVALLGRLTPDAWMRRAVGAPLSAEPLLAAAERALAAVGGEAGEDTAGSGATAAAGGAGR
jgi:hypothetical protein